MDTQKGRLTTQQIVIGQAGSGKTYKTKKILSKISHESLVIFIHNGENKLSELPTFDITNVKKIPKDGMYAIHIDQLSDLYIEKTAKILTHSGTRYVKKVAKADIFTFLGAYVRKAHIVFDDALAYISSNISGGLKTILTNRRQFGFDVWFNFQSINAVPPMLWYNVTHIWQFYDTSKPTQNKEKTPDWILPLLLEHQELLAKNYDPKNGKYPYFMWVAQKAQSGQYQKGMFSNRIWDKEKGTWVIPKINKKDKKNSFFKQSLISYKK